MKATKATKTRILLVEFTKPQVNKHGSWQPGDRCEFEQTDEVLAAEAAGFLRVLESYEVQFS